MKPWQPYKLQIGPLNWKQWVSVIHESEAILREITK